MPDMPAQVPIADARSSERNDPWMIASAPGATIAAATPCSTRKPISSAGVCANAHRALPSANAAMPIR